MNQEKIQSTLIHLFEDESRWENRSRRVVFWYDTDQSFQEEFEALELEEIQKHTLEENNIFQTKIMLEEMAADSRCLIYAPQEPPRPEDNWLLDALKYGETFSADRAFLILTDLGLLDRSLVGYLRQHLKFFQNKKRMEALQQLHITPEISENQLRIAMMSAVVGLKTPDALGVIRKVLLDGLKETENTLWETLTSFFEPSEFWNLCQDELGYSETGEYPPSLKRLFLKLAVTHFSHSFQGAFPNAMLPFVMNPSHIPFKFVDDWLHHSEDSQQWKAMSQQVTEDLNILSLVSDYEVSQYQECDTFLTFDLGVIRSIVQDLKAKSEDYTRLRDLINRRKTLHWHKECETLYQALWAAIDLFEHYKGFKTDWASLSAKELFTLYTQELFKIDQAYRKYILASDASASHDVIKPLSEDVENLYVNWYLAQLSQHWDKVLEKELLGDWELPFVKSQQGFAASNIEKIMARNDKEKVFVIISDALRYEVAEELSNYLIQKLRGTANLECQLGTLPSVTKLGMAALLPQPRKSLTFDGNGNVLVDGQSTMGLESRKAILEKGGKNWKGTALKANDLMEMTVNEGRELLSPYRVIYLYHDRIDMTGDKLVSEPHVFKACQDTIEELTRLVSRITKSLNGTNVIITADHGFLYQRQELEESDKITLPNIKFIDRSKRHLVSPDSGTIEGTHSMALNYLGDEVNHVWVPKGNLRFKIKGGGRQFVHGGASLQEICVPVLKYKDVRLATGESGPNKKVMVQVNARHKRITNNIFTLNLLQTEPVKDKVLARRIKVGFYDPEKQNEAITNEKVIELNSTSPNANDREIKLQMTVAITQSNANQDYHLIIRDADDGTELLREAWKVNLGIINEFGFDI